MEDDKREINKTMLADVEWLHRQMKSMGKGFNKYLAAQYVGRSVEFIKGVLWQKEQVRKNQTEKEKT